MSRKRLPSLGWSPNNPRMVTHQKEVNYRLKIWHLDLNYENNIQRTAAIDGHQTSKGWYLTN